MIMAKHGDYLGAGIGTHSVIGHILAMGMFMDGSVLFCFPAFAFRIGVTHTTGEELPVCNEWTAMAKAILMLTQLHSLQG